MSPRVVSSRHGGVRSQRRRRRQNLTKRLYAFVGTEEYELIVLAARRTGVSISRWVAETAVRAARDEASGGATTKSLDRP